MKYHGLQAFILLTVFSCSSLAYHTDCYNDLPHRCNLRFPDKTPAFFYVPHQDDDAIGAAMLIGEQIDAQRDVFVFLYAPLTTGLPNLELINGSVYCDRHCTRHKLRRTIDNNDLLKSRDLEFLSSTSAMGVPNDNVWICPWSSDRNRSLQIADMGNLIRNLETTFPGASHKGPAGWYDGACFELDCNATSIRDDVPERFRSQPHCGYPHHALFFDAFTDIFASRVFDNIDMVMYRIYTFFNVGSDRAQYNYVPSNAKSILARKQAALRAYQFWDPNNNRFAYGYHSVPTIFIGTENATNILLDYHPDDPKHQGGLLENSCVTTSYSFNPNCNGSSILCK